MSDKIYEIPAEWKKRAYVDDAKYHAMYERSVADPDGFWAEQASASTGSSPSPRSRTPPSTRATSRSSGSRTAPPTSPTTASTAISPSAATRPRSSGKATIPTDSRKITYRSCTTRSAASPTCCNRNVGKGRPRHHLPADDPGGGLRHAGLRAHRRDPFGGVRRLLARSARRPHRGLQVERRHHRRRRLARRPQGAAQGQHRRGDREGSAASTT